MPTTISTHLMFQDGRAAEAMELYLSLFPGSRVLSDQRYGPETGEAAGTVMVARIEVSGSLLQLADSPISHDFGFTPSSSLFVDFEDLEALVKAHAALSVDGSELMPLGEYGFSQRFAWVQDRFGVSWQLNLP